MVDIWHAVSYYMHLLTFRVDLNVSHEDVPVFESLPLHTFCTSPPQTQPRCNAWGTIVLVYSFVPKFHFLCWYESREFHGITFNLSAAHSSIKFTPEILLKISAFITYVPRFKDNIILVQAANWPLNVAPPYLPRTSTHCPISVKSVWNIKRCHQDAMDIYVTNRLGIQSQGKGDWQEI